MADSCAKVIGKGCSVKVEGRLQMDEWDDKETGKKRSKIKVRADRVIFLSFKDRSKDEGEGRQMSDGTASEIMPPVTVRDAPFDEEPPF